jgi:hypothetical protein
MLQHITGSTNLLRAIEALVWRTEETTFKDWLIAQRKRGASYHTIARDLETVTDGAVRLTGESIRRYCDELEVEVLVA